MDAISGRLLLSRGPLVRRLDRASRALLSPDGGRTYDFSCPAGEAALGAPTSVAWRIFKNPVTLFIGGITAVILELAEPRVRTGVWEHSGFRKDPVRRLRRTGHAAMVTVYGARSVAETMIASVRRMHERVRGQTPGGDAYYANDPELLNWVQATAAFGFMHAYHTYAAPLRQAERNRYYREGKTAARLYGAAITPASEAELWALFDAMRERLEPSPILFEFLDIIRTAPILPAMLRPAQPLLVRAALSLTPPEIRGHLELSDNLCLRAWEGLLVRQGAALADRIILESSPAVQACLRLGLPANYLYDQGAAATSRT